MSRSRRARPRRPINDDTSLRKLMRYARRGKLPSERMQVIKRAMENAVRRPFKYMHSHARNVAEALDAQYEQYAATRG